MKMNHLKFALLVLVFLLSSNRFVSAAPISFDLSGTIEVSNDDGLLPSDLISGLTFTGRFTYDNSVPDSLLGDPLIGLYDHNPVGGPVGQFELSISIGQHDFLADPSRGFSLTIRNDNLPPALFPGDSIMLSTNTLIPPNLNSISGFGFLNSISIRFSDPSGVALSSDELPKDISPTSFDTAEIRIHGISSVITNVVGATSDSYTITAAIDTITPVPEPSSFHLFSLAFFTLSIMFLIKQFLRRKKCCSINFVLKR